MPESYWLSCKKFTVWVAVDDDEKIIKAAPVVKKFVGQPLANLEKWFASFGGFKKEKMGTIRAI